jgi:hypothetical protein
VKIEIKFFLFLLGFVFFQIFLVELFKNWSFVRVQNRFHHLVISSGANSRAKLQLLLDLGEEIE